jgi:1-acyl-sn-glycerol-3-phosphate acyltransferase
MWFDFCRNLCRIFCKICFRVRVYGKENIPKEGAVLLVSNHQSFVDPLFCGNPLKRQITFLARDTLFKNRFFGAILRSVNAIPVRRGEADVGAMKTIIARLKEGGVVCLFPEGTRTEDGRINELKAGFGLLARRGGAAIVPVLIDGAFECWPRDKKLFKLRSAVTVHYGSPFSFEQVKETDERQLAAELTATLRKMQHEHRKSAGKDAFDY